MKDFNLEIGVPDWLCHMRQWTFDAFLSTWLFAGTRL
jgi:hypothetical protein